jgi:hypothetical protein
MQDYTNDALPSHVFEAHNETPDAGRLEELADLASGRTPPDGINRSMALARKALGLDVAFVWRFIEDRMEFRALEGNAGSFGGQVGGSIPLDGTISKRVVDGRAESSLKNRERRFSAPLSVALAMSQRLVKESRIGICVGGDCV